MYGTLAGALAGRKVEFDRDRFTAHVDGTVEGPNKGTIRITRIHVTYQLRIPAAQRASAVIGVCVSACTALQRRPG